MTGIGVQISSVKKYLQTPQDVLESFKKVSKMGYRNIQLQWISPEIPGEFIKEALQEAKLNCLGTQDYYDEVIPNLDEILRRNELYGSNYICVSGIPQRYNSYEGCLKFAKELNKIAEKLEPSGKKLLLHPRHQEFIKYGEKFALDILLENTADNFQLELDVYHVIKASCDAQQWIKKLKGRMDLIHFKDGFINEKGEEILTPVGQGNIEWESIFKACMETGVKYGLAEQETWQKDPFQCLEDSYKYITAGGISSKNER